MKRYWKLMVIVPLIVIVIGTFYITSAMSAGSYPEIVFKKEQGNETAIQDVVLDGRYFADDFSSELTLTTDGTAYEANKPFFERVAGMYNQRVAHLQDQYRGFMRGKSGTASFYVETDNIVGYADVINQSFGSEKSTMEFTVAVLNKENKEAIEFTAIVPNRAMYSGVRIQDVQYVNDELKVITRNFLKQSRTTDMNEEIHVYSFNMDKKELTDDEMITKAGHNVHIDPLYMLYHYNTGSNHIVVFKKIKEETVQSQGNMNNGAGAVAQQIETKVDSITAYNLKTEEKLDVKLPEKLRNNEILAVEGSSLYLQSAAKEKMEVVQYDMTQGKVTNRYVVASSNKESQQMNASTIQVDDGKLYVLIANDNSPVTQQLKVIHIDSGETVYAGEITLEEPSGENEVLHFFQMNIR